MGRTLSDHEREKPLYVIASVYYPLKQTFNRYQWIGFDHIKEFAIS